MKTTFLDAKGVGHALDRLMQEHLEYHWIVAWGTCTAHADHLIRHRRRIKRMVFGLSFGLTDPKLLEALGATSGVRVVEDTPNGVFHPKTYFFASNDTAAAIVGSANFTRGGTGRNAEAALLIEGRRQDEPFPAIEAAVADAYHSATKIDDKLLDAYRLKHRYWQTQRSKEPDVRQLKRAAASRRRLLHLDWDGYVQSIQGAPDAHLDERLEVLRNARALLAGRSLMRLAELERKAIAGTLGRRKF